NVQNINRESTTKVIEALGNEQENRKKHPGIDPEKWAQTYARKLTEEQKRNQRLFSLTKIPINKFSKINNDCLTLIFFFKSLYHQLKLDDICQAIANRHSFSYDLNRILEILMYMRVLHPTSKRGTLERSE